MAVSPKVSLRLPPDLYDRVSAMAVAEHRTLSNLVTHFIVAGLANGSQNGHAVSIEPMPFMGKVLEIDPPTWARWQDKYRNIPDLRSAVAYVDDYIDHHPELQHNPILHVETYLAQEDRGVPIPEA